MNARLHGQAVWEDDSQPRVERRAKDVTLVGYAEDVVMVALAATIEELEWKCNETLEIVSCWMKSQKLLVSSFERYNLEGNKMYVQNIGLHLRCNAEKVIYNSWNYLIFF